MVVVASCLTGHRKGDSTPCIETAIGRYMRQVRTQIIPADVEENR